MRNTFPSFKPPCLCISMMVARTDQDSTLTSNSKQIHLLKRCTWWCGGRQVGGLRGRQRAVRRWPAEARLGAPARGSPAPTASCKLDLCLPPSPRHPLPSTTADPSLVQTPRCASWGPAQGPSYTTPFMYCEALRRGPPRSPRCVDTHAHFCLGYSFN